MKMRLRARITGKTVFSFSAAFFLAVLFLGISCFLTEDFGLSGCLLYVVSFIVIFLLALVVAFVFRLSKFAIEHWDDEG